MSTAPFRPRPPLPYLAKPKPDPGTTGNPLLFTLLAFLVAFPWIAQLLPQHIREYIGILFR
jgi:hypothetical protein